MTGNVVSDLHDDVVGTRHYLIRIAHDGIGNRVDVVGRVVKLGISHGSGSCRTGNGAEASSK
jgi:hypothetical protein